MSDDAGDQPTAGDAVMHSFRGQALEGADFSGKDLRGADFSGANLRSANFREAKVGVAPRVGVVIMGIGMLIAIGTGMVIGWAVDEIRNEATAEEWDEVASGRKRYIDIPSTPTVLSPPRFGHAPVLPPHDRGADFG